MASNRPKGFAPWSPSPDVQIVLDQVHTVLDEYRDYLPLTNRQIFYRLVGAYSFEKTEKAYKRLCNYLTRARRAQIIKFSAIRDDKVNRSHDAGWSGLDSFQQAVRESADHYKLDALADQANYIELWCEAEGMMPQMSRVADDYTIPVYSAGGFLSVTATHDLAARCAQRWERTQHGTILLHIGDYDPSGESIFETIALDAGRFARTYTGASVLQPVRVALTLQQVQEHDLPTAPPKHTDSRSWNWDGETAQAEAMPPDLLAATVREAVEHHLDLGALERTREREVQERARLQDWLDSLA